MQTLDSNGNARETQDAHIFADQDVIADAQARWERDFHICPDHDAVPDFCAQRAKEGKA